MNKSDFDETTITIVNEFSDAIIGGLAYSWDAVRAMKENESEDREWLRTQLFFLLQNVRTAMERCEQ